MQIGGWQRLSLIDYPDRLAAILFTLGCPFRCHYCYNPSLVVPPFKQLDLSEFFEFLKSRQGKLEAVVITGGEPTLHDDLIELVKSIKDLGFLVKLDTNGYYPDKLKKVLESGLIDYVAMDIKAPLDKYSQVVGKDIDETKIFQSIKLIMNSSIPYEFRSTLVEGLHELADVPKMAQLIQGAPKYFLQSFRPSKDLINPSFSRKVAFSPQTMNDLAKQCLQYVQNCQIR